MVAIQTSPVDEIKERLDISEVLSEYVRLKPSGPNRFKVLCPFHQEKTPSLMVSKDRQAWHCFGCGKGGDMFTFVQEIEGVEFPEALRILAKKANVELRRVDPELQNAKTKLLDVVKLAAAFYRKVLTDLPAAQIARDYLKERAINDETAEDFQLGYSPTSWDALLIVLRKRGVTDQDMFNAGLVVKRERGVGYYDRFRGRLMFPIRDANGQTVGFGGRIIEAVEGDAAAAAKYINSPETLIYSKSNVLYGFDRARQAMRQADLAVLVEGYMDCIASHQAEVRNVAAVSGTALTPQHVRLLKRAAMNIALAFDADLAGGEAARRGVDLAVAEDMRVTIITLPQAKDPDELIRRDPAAWRNAIAQRQRIVDYSLARAFAQYPELNVDDKKSIAKILLPVIARLPDPVEQSHYLRSLSDRLQVDESSLRDALRRASVQTSSKTVQPPAPPLPPVDRPQLVAERVFALGFFHNSTLFDLLSEQLDPEVLGDPELQSLYRQAVLYYSQNHQLDHAGFEQYISRELAVLKPRLERVLLLAERDFETLEEKEARQEIDDGIRFLRRHAISGEIRQIQADLQRAEQAHATDQANHLLRRLDELTSTLHRLDQ